jgi:hypothetical protein
MYGVMNMKKSLMVLCAVFVILLMVSSVTAVPQTRDKTALEILKDRPLDSNGFLGDLIAFLLVLLQLIPLVLEFVSSIFALINLPQVISDLIDNFYELLELLGAVLMKIQDILGFGS